MDPAAPLAATTGGGRGFPLLRPLADRDFRLLFSGETISVLGDQFHFVALAWLALQLTGSGLVLGTVLMTAAIPRAILMLVGGAFSDRFSPRTLMLTSNLVRGLVVGTLAALVLTDNAQLWQLYLLAGVFGIVDAFFFPAMHTIMPMLVTERQLPAANALVQGAEQLAALIGPALAGLLVAAVQTGPAFAIDAASFLVAALALALLRGGRRSGPLTADGSSRGILGTIGGGIAYAWADPALRSLILVIAAINFAFTGPVSVGMAWLAEVRFDGGPAAFGFLLAGYGGGAVVGAIVAGSLAVVPRLGAIVVAISALLGLGLAGIGLAPNVPVALAIMTAMGVLVGFTSVRVRSWIQARVPDEVRGRVMSVVMLGSFGTAPVSFAAAGALVDAGATTAMFVGAGGIMIAAGLAGVAWGLPGGMSQPGDASA